MSWYNTGYESVVDEEKRLASLDKPRRLWIRPQEEKKIIFIDDSPVAIYEHQPCLNGSYMNWITCLQGVSDDTGCPACQLLGNNTRYFVGYWTVIDCSKWTDKQEKVHQDEIVLLAAKIRSFKLLKACKEKYKSLAGSMFSAIRITDKSPACGDGYMPERDNIDMGKLFNSVMYKGKHLSKLMDEAEKKPDSMQRLMDLFQIRTDPSNPSKIIREIPPFNYLKVLEPMSAKDMRLLLNNGCVSRGSSMVSSISGDSRDMDELPF